MIFLRRLLDVEALGRLDVLEVDAAEGRLERLDDPDDLVGVVRVQLDVEHVDVGEALEEDALALHDGLAGQRADVAEAEHGGAVADDGDEVALARVAIGERPGPARSPGTDAPRRACRPATGRAGSGRASTW